MKNYGKGFTLVELLVALIVVAILVSIAAPSFQDLIKRQRLKAVVETLLSDMRTARSEALALGLAESVSVSFAYSSSGQTWSYSIANTGTLPTVTRSHSDYAGGVTAAVTGWGASSSAASFSITPVRSLNVSGVGTITFALESLSVKVERNLLGGVFVCSANGDLGYSTCT
ncbi:MAG: prepilin-type N-terminal cleavage/methylation domain-containing protein [Luminiphilus sp.]|nr:prepilin-type N-terminal cleavage/methylation domain-containing protein [Luminiphilus sp.]